MSTKPFHCFARKMSFIVQKKQARKLPDSQGSESGFFVGKVRVFCRKSLVVLSEVSLVALGSGLKRIEAQHLQRALC